MSFTLMRINKADDSRRCWLLGHPCSVVRSSTPTGSERRSVQRLQNMQTGTGWKEKTLSDQGNQHVEFEGGGTREFASALEAWRYKNSLCGPDSLQPHPWAGDVVLRMPTGADTFEEVLMPGAVLSLAPILGGGSSLALTYTAKAPHVELLRTGVRSEMWVMANPHVSAIMHFFGTKVGGDYTSDTTPDTDTLTTTLPSSYLLWIDVDEDVGGVLPYEARFYVRASGGGSAVGHVSIDSPLVDHFAALITALDDDYVTASAVTVAGRSALRLQCVNVGGGGVSNTRIRVRVYQGNTTAFLLYDGEIYGDEPIRSRLMFGAQKLMVDQST